MGDSVGDAVGDPVAHALLGVSLVPLDVDAVHYNATHNNESVAWKVVLWRCAHQSAMRWGLLWETPSAMSSGSLRQHQKRCV